jgi:GDP-mannose 6-dehydrogenase
MYDGARTDFRLRHAAQDLAPVGPDVAVFGLGYVGTVTASCLSLSGHHVIGVDPDPHKVTRICAGRSPIVEPQIGDIIASGVRDTRLRAAAQPPADLHRSVQAMVVCVGTPSQADGSLELRFLEQVCRDIARVIAQSDLRPVVIFRSTMLPGTLEGVLLPLLERASGRRAGEDFSAVMCPEFLREGTAVSDFSDPPFTVIGGSDAWGFRVARALFDVPGRPYFAVPVRTAEAVKYACNAFHATKVAFTNEISRAFSASGVDTRTVMDIFTADDRLNISSAYLRPGFSFGGSCLPKDLRALIRQSQLQGEGVPLLAAALESNQIQTRRAVQNVLDTGAQKVAMLGLSFKDGTDDLRESPLVELAEILLGKGLELRIFDRSVRPERLFGSNGRHALTHLPHLDRLVADTPAAAIADADAVIIGTSDAGAVEAVVRARPAHVIDLHGRLPQALEELPGYRGLSW